MDRLTKVAIGLLAFNAGFFCLARDEPPPDVNNIRLRIASLEQTLPLRKANTAWLEKVKPALESPPQEEPADVLGRLRDMAAGWHFEILEAANRGGTPTTVVVLGHGSFQAVAALIGEIERSEATRLESLSLSRRDDGTLDASFEMVIRRGPWVGAMTDQRPAPLPAPPVIHQLINDPFTPSAQSAPAVSAAPAQKPGVRFTGFFSGPRGVTAFIESGNQVILLNPGDRLPTGEAMATASEDQIEFQDTRGTRWSYEMEKPR